MKIKVTMKCPDALDQAIEKAAEDEVGGPMDSSEHDERWKDLVLQGKKVATKWFKWGEYVTLEIDTEANTCIVLPT